MTQREKLTNCFQLFTLFVCLTFSIEIFYFRGSNFHWVTNQFDGSHFANISVPGLNIRHFLSAFGEADNTTSRWDETNHTHLAVKYNCSSSNRSRIYEDILCMKSPVFLKNYKNPCWYQRNTNYAFLKKQFRCLPHFHIIGSAKCGTSDLFKRITEHPQVLANKGIREKETMYWSWKRYGECEGSEWCTNGRKMTFRRYLAFFPSEKIKYNKTTDEHRPDYHDLVTGHGDPMDIWAMYHWKSIPQNDRTWDEPIYTTPHLIKHMNPNVKLIVVLRQPSERIYSHYLFRKIGRTPWRFHRDTTTALNKMKKCLQKHSIRACLFNQTLMYELDRFPLHGSVYSVLLKEWFSVFPREQFLIMRTEDYERDIAGTLATVFKFLDLREIPETTLQKSSSLPHQFQTTRSRISQKMFRKTKQMLDNFFDEYNKDLANLLHDQKYLWNDLDNSDTVTETELEADYAKKCVLLRNLPNISVKDRNFMERLKFLCRQ